MGRDESLDRQREMGFEWEIGAYTQSTENEILFRITGREEEFRAYARNAEELALINAWLKEQVDLERLYDDLQKKAWEKERQRKMAKLKQIKKRYYGTLPAEQYLVYLLREGCEMAYEKIAEFTGGSQEALRKAYHDAKKNVELIDLELL
jgi:DNA-directed RNA polymerase specialized sigma24 family protein